MLKRRLWPLLLVVGVVVGGRLFLHRSVDVTVAVELPSPAPTSVELLFVRSDDKEVARDVVWTVPPAGVLERAVRLPEGRYDVDVRLRGEHTASLVRPLDVEGAGRYILDLR